MFELVFPHIVCFLCAQEAEVDQWGGSLCAVSSERRRSWVNATFFKLFFVLLSSFVFF